jgi:hypothetical protein
MTEHPHKLDFVGDDLTAEAIREFRRTNGRMPTRDETRHMTDLFLEAYLCPRCGFRTMTNEGAQQHYDKYLAQGYCEGEDEYQLKGGGGCGTCLGALAVVTIFGWALWALGV